MDKEKLVSGQTRSTPQAQNDSPKVYFSIFSALKYVAIFIAVLFTAIIQTGFFVEFRPLGSSPDLCLALCVAVSLRWGAKKGAIIGIMSGFCVDALSSTGISLLIPFYFMISVLLGLFAESNNTQGFTVFISALPIAALLRVVLMFLEICLTTPSFSASEIFFKAVIPHFIITVIFSPIFHLAVFTVDKIFGKSERALHH